MLLEGIIMQSANTTQYSHTLLVGSGLYGLRSKTILLSDFSGTIIIKGTIVDIIKEIPIVSVDELVSKTKILENALELNENFYYSPVLQIGMDLTQAK
jgi:hypothetical protein